MKDKYDSQTLSFPEMEGDFFYKEKAQEEAYVHFTLAAFEHLLYRHGLDFLLGQMSTESVTALLTQAHVIIHARKR